MQYFEKELHNGNRILHVPARTITAWCGLYINTGTRDEEKGEGGIAHFFEHVLFKGTERRPAWRIISSIDDSGGELNAYTTKEETFVYASFLRSELKKAVDILTDITFHSTFPEKEVEKERGVILDEIESYKDDPVESLFDKFDALYFKGHPLEKPILGTTASVKKITREQLSGFVKRKYNTDQIIFCSVGNFNFERICKYAEPLLNEVPASIRSFERKPFMYTTPFHTTQKEDIHSAYYLLATHGPSRKERLRAPHLLFNNILGGPSLTSVLNLSLREKNGLTYSVESQLNAYSDCGTMHIFLNTDKSKLEKAVGIVEKELKKLRETALSPTQLQRAKKQVKGAMALADDNKDRIIHYMGRSFLHNGHILSVHEIMRQIDEVSSQDLLQVANEHFAPEIYSSFRLLPKN